jgi:hypothetical protein
MIFNIIVHKIKHGYRLRCMLFSVSHGEWAIILLKAWLQSISPLQVESIVLGEDCALLEQGSSVGRRGMCGMVFVFKVNLGASVGYYIIVNEY